VTHADRDRVMRIIMARCGDVLSDADLASIEARSQPAEMLPSEVAEQILTVLDSMMDRLDELTAIVRDDGDHDRRGDRRARQAGEGNLVGGR
jgi:hypothetical protein